MPCEFFSIAVPSATELLALFLYEADLAATAAKELQQPDGSNGNGEALVISEGSTGMALPLERSSSAVECLTRNRESPSSVTPFATVSEFEHFRSLHDAPDHSAVEISTWL